MVALKVFGGVVTLVAFSIVLLLPAGPANIPEEKIGSELLAQPIVVKSPNMKPGEPVKIPVRDFLESGKEYEIWSEGPDCCRPLGEVGAKDTNIIFVEKKEEPETIGTITLPLIPSDSAPKIKNKDSSKRVFNKDEAVYVPEGYDVKTHPCDPDKLVLVPNEYFKKPEEKKASSSEEGVFYSTTPLYTRELPDGSVEFTLVHPDGSETVEIIPPLP